MNNTTVYVGMTSTRTLFLFAAIQSEMMLALIM